MSHQNDIIHHLTHVGSLTPLEALDSYGCFRLGARILELRQEGYEIKTTMVKNGNKRYASYSMEGK